MRNTPVHLFRRVCTANLSPYHVTKYGGPFPLCGNRVGFVRSARSAELGFVRSISIALGSFGRLDPRSLGSFGQFRSRWLRSVGFLLGAWVRSVSGILDFGAGRFAVALGPTIETSPGRRTSSVRDDRLFKERLYYRAVGLDDPKVGSEFRSTASINDDVSLLFWSAIFMTRSQVG